MGNEKGIKSKSESWVGGFFSLLQVFLKSIDQFCLRFYLCIQVFAVLFLKQ